MLRLAQFERAAGLRAGMDQFLRLQHIAAVVALVGTRPLEAADVAGAFHVAVRQELVRRG